AASRKRSWRHRMGYRGALPQPVPQERPMRSPRDRDPAASPTDRRANGPSTGAGAGPTQSRAGAVARPDGRRAVGRGGEGGAGAAAWLEARGLGVLGRNVRAGGVELALVAARGRTLAFVEVKTRRSRSAGAPEEAVDARKRARLVRGASAWLATHGGRGWQVRFDVVTCEAEPNGTWRVRHLENAFDAGD